MGSLNDETKELLLKEAAALSLKAAKDTEKSLVNAAEGDIPQDGAQDASQALRSITNAAETAVKTWGRERSWDIDL